MRILIVRQSKRFSLLGVFRRMRSAHAIKLRFSDGHAHYQLPISTAGKSYGMGSVFLFLKKKMYFRYL